MVFRGVFAQREITSQKKFQSQFESYNKEMNDEFEWGPNQIVLESSKVRIQYMHWDENEQDQVEPQFEIWADNGESFTALELLYKIHNEVASKLADEDAHFFEGLKLYDEGDDSDTPLYFLRQGN